jgi:hypothetical protein
MDPNGGRVRTAVYVHRLFPGSLEFLEKFRYPSIPMFGFPVDLSLSLFMRN